MKSSISLKLFKVVFSTYLVVTVVMLVIQILLGHANTKIKIVEQLSSIKQSFSKSMENALGSMNKDKLEVLGQTLLNFPVVEGFQLKRVENSRYKESYTSVFNKGKVNSNIKIDFIIESKDELGHSIIGKGTIFSSRKKVLDRFLFYYLVSILTDILKTIFLLILLYWSFKKILIVPLNRLMKNVGELNLDNLKKINSNLETIEPNELNFLENVINKIITDLKTTQDNLKISAKENASLNQNQLKLNVELEKKVLELNRTLLKVGKLNKELKLKNMQVEEEHRQLTVLLDQVKFFNKNLEIMVADKIKEVQGLLENIQIPIFTIGSNYKIIDPVSKYSKRFFEKNITGKHIMEVLFFNVKKGSEEHEKIINCLPKVFGGDKIQFYLMTENLPKKISLPTYKKKKLRTLKIAYAPLLDEEEKVKKLMFIVDDITDIDRDMEDAYREKLQIVFVREIINNENKEELSTSLQNSISIALETLDDFVSPLSHDHSREYFSDRLEEAKLKIRGHIDKIASLKEVIDFTLVFDWGGKQSSTRMWAIEEICLVLETLVLYVNVAALFFPINYNLNYPFTNTIIEKINDLNKVFKNLFEYVFLVREVHSIDRKSLERLAGVARLYPEFDKTIELIHQRAKLLGFLLKAVMEDELAKVYNDLAKLVKQMPDRKRLTESVIKFSLIDPYKLILDKTEDIEVKLEERMKEKQKNYLSEEDYMDLLIDILKRFTEEEKNGPSSELKKTPTLDEKQLKDVDDLISGMETMLSRLEEKDKIMVRKTIIYNLETGIRNVFENEIRKENCLPITRHNKKFIKFLKTYS